MRPRPRDSHVRLRTFRTSLFTCLCLMGFVLAQRLSTGRQELQQPKKRSVAVADTIRMTRLAETSYSLGDVAGAIALFSPDGQWFVVSVKRGNIEQNTNDYSLLLYRSAEALESPKARELITMRSSSNREAVKSVKWLNDSETLLFLGENAGEGPQIYKLNIKTKGLTRLTNHSTAVTNFDVSDNGDTIVFAADPIPEKSVDTAAARRNGIVITSQYPSDLLAGDCGDLEKSGSAYKDVFVVKQGRAPSKVAIGDFVRDFAPLSVSPDGHYALLAPYLAKVPGAWSEYEDKLLRPYILAAAKAGIPSNIQQYMLLDTAKLEVTPLLDAPISWYNRGIAWLTDSHSVVLSGIYLPLPVRNSAENDARRTHTFVAEIRLPGKDVVEISEEGLRVDRFDSATRKLFLSSADAADSRASQAYEKTKGGWKRVDGRGSEREIQDTLDVTLLEGMNDPPKIFVRDMRTGQKKLLLDLNPQFDQIEFGRVEAVEWKASDGHEVAGGLYLPPSSKRGTRYPLVIQTHGFNKNRFWIDGPYSSAFAAQPLAALGFIVLQVGGSIMPGEDAKYVNTPREAPRQMAAYEGAIDYLDERGLIDRGRVGIVGFSRTVFYVGYTLTHSKYPFVAATLADGFDGGYLNFMLWRGRVDYGAVMGGPPVGPSLALWLQNSPGFNLDKVTAAVRIEDYGAIGPLEGWQWFSGLRYLEKPVDFIWLPFGTHLLVTPCERLASLQGNVDWFAFWLQGKEDRRASNALQYDRWNGLQVLRNRNIRVPPAN
jgi:dipeptidyl aminopeptidase/acylaminoacyl peptidase